MPAVVSVVVPVFNAADHLDELFASLFRQSIGFDRIEVVAVDDGSTDASGARLDEIARRHPNVKVLHQANSGAPGGPRNRAIGESTGEFLFFADPDDYLGDEALERMVAAAERDGADVVLGRVVGVGRPVPQEPFARDVAGGDVWSTNAIWSLTAHKLFRRRLVVDNDLRFGEGLRLAEEQQLVVPAYFLARAISVVASYDCYHLVDRGQGGHLTQEVPDPAVFFDRAISPAVEAVHRHTAPGPARQALLKRFARVEVLNKFGARFVPLRPKQQQELVEQSRRFLDRWFGDDLDDVAALLTPLEAVRLRLIRLGDREALAALATTQLPKTSTPDGSIAAFALCGPPGEERLRRLGIRPEDGRGVTVRVAPADGHAGEEHLVLRRPGVPEVTLPVPATHEVCVSGEDLAPGEWAMALAAADGSHAEVVTGLRVDSYRSRGVLGVARQSGGDLFVHTHGGTVVLVLPAVELAEIGWETGDVPGLRLEASLRWPAGAGPDVLDPVVRVRLRGKGRFVDVSATVTAAGEGRSVLSAFLDVATLHDELGNGVWDPFFTTAGDGHLSPLEVAGPLTVPPRLFDHTVLEAYRTVDGRLAMRVQDQARASTEVVLTHLRWATAGRRPALAAGLRVQPHLTSAFADGRLVLVRRGDRVEAAVSRADGEGALVAVVPVTRLGAGRWVLEAVRSADGDATLPLRAHNHLESGWRSWRAPLPRAAHAWAGKGRPTLVVRSTAARLRHGLTRRLGIRTR